MSRALLDSLELPHWLILAGILLLIAGVIGLVIDRKRLQKVDAPNENSEANENSERNRPGWSRQGAGAKIRLPRAGHRTFASRACILKQGSLAAGAPRVAYCCDLLSSSWSRISSDTKRSARCHASSLSPRNVKNFLNTTRWDLVSMAAVRASCTSVLIL